MKTTKKYYNEKYIKNFDVIGVLISARGTIPRLVLKMWRQFKLYDNILTLDATIPMKYSISVVKVIHTTTFKFEKNCKSIICFEAIHIGERILTKN